MSNNEIARFEPEKLVDRVRERIRGTIADLIPEDAWTAMVQKEVDLFLKETTRERRYGYSHDSEKVPSGLAQVVHAVLTEETRRHVKMLLDGPEWQAGWNVSGHVSVAVAALVKENAHSIVAALLGDAVQRFVSEISQRIQR
jgi:hypothetical protein